MLLISSYVKTSVVNIIKNDLRLMFFYVNILALLKRYIITLNVLL